MSSGAAEDKLDLLPLSHLQASQVTPVVKNPPANAGDTRDAGSILGQDFSLSLVFLRENWGFRNSCYGTVF